MSGVRRSANEVLAIVACPDRHESAGGGRLRERAPALPFLLRPKRKLIEDTVPLELQHRQHCQLLAGGGKRLPQFQIWLSTTGAESGRLRNVYLMPNQMLGHRASTSRGLISRASADPSDVRAHDRLSDGEPCRHIGLHRGRVVLSG
jgi:hypothetical protein